MDTSSQCKNGQCLIAGACVHMAVHEPADHLLLTVEPLMSATQARARVKHTITLLDPANGTLFTILSLLQQPETVSTITPLGYHPSQGCNWEITPLPCFKQSGPSKAHMSA